MKQNRLGKTNCIVSRIGCGGIPIQRATLEDAKKIIDAMEEHHMNFIDTARGYTISESLFGKALVGRREKFFLATKSMARTYEKMKKDIQQSLTLLNTSYIDLYQCHNLKMGEDYQGALEALKEAKREGKIHHIGITSHSLEMLMSILDSNEFETIQFPYNLLERQAEELFKKAYERNMGIIAMKPFAGGAIQDYSLGLKFILNHPYISVVIPGMENERQVHENSSVSEGKYTLDELERIEEIRLKLNQEFCRRCGYCKPCSVGIDIPTCFILEGYDERYQLKEWAKSRYDQMKVPASSCIECHLCETRCPYQLKIVNKLKEVVQRFEK